MTQITRDRVLDVVNRTNYVLQEWDASDSPNTNWRGQVVKQMSREVETSLDELCSLATQSNVDENAREIVLAIDLVATEFAAWAQAVDVAPDTVHPSGTPELRTALRVMRNACVIPQASVPDAIRDLMGLGTPDVQICKMYGFLTADNEPDFTKLSEEKQKPGTHFDPKTWRSPAEIRRQRETNERWADRQPVDYQSVVEIHEPRQPRISPEAIEDLIGIGVKAEQIARMKGLTIEQVEQYAAQHRLPLNGKIVKPADMNDKERTDLASRQIELHPQSHPEIESLEDRVLECALDGMKAVDIAEALSVDHPGLSWQKASAIIRQFEKEGRESLSEDADVVTVD